MDLRGVEGIWFSVKKYEGGDNKFGKESKISSRNNCVS